MLGMKGVNALEPKLVHIVEQRPLSKCESLGEIKGLHVSLAIPPEFGLI